MSAPAKLAAFTATLAVLFGGGVLAGAIDPDPEEPRAAHAAADPRTDGAHGAGEKEGRGRVHFPPREPGRAHGAGERAAHPVRGLAVAENGLRLVVEDPELRRGRTEDVRFRIVDEAGETVATSRSSTSGACT